MTSKIAVIGAYTIKSEYRDNTTFNGIVDAFHKQRRFKFFDLINVTATSKYAGKPPENTLNRTQKWWESQPQDNQSIKYIFNKGNLFISSLSLQSNSEGNPDFPRKFIVYGSVDDNVWTEIASTEEKTYFKFKGEIVNFPVDKGYFKYIKLVQQGLNEKGDNHFCFENIEFYGTYTRTIAIPTQGRCSNTRRFMLFYILMIWKN